MVELPNVTLVIIDNIACELSALALQSTLRQVTPNMVIWESDPRIDSLLAVAKMLWHSTPYRLTTSHMLTIQYDGWVLDGSRWRDEWLEYDYIGAPWPWHRENRVGNGGFSLRSARLMRFLAEHQGAFPVKTPEDEALCREYRPSLEAHGFRFAPIEVARDFAFEREPPRPTFGYHGMFNYPRVLNEDELQIRMGKANAYVRSKSEWREIAQ